MHQYTPDTTTFHATVSNVDDGDAADATAWNNGDDDVADNAAYLHTKLLAWIAGGTITPAATVTIQRKIMTSAGFDIEAGDDLIAGDDVSAGGDITAGDDITAGGSLIGLLRLKYGGQLTDANHTIAMGDGFNIYDYTLVQDTRTLTISDTGAATGDMLIFFTKSGTEDPDFTLPATGTFTSAVNSWYVFMRSAASTWIIILRGSF